VVLDHHPGVAAVGEDVQCSGAMSGSPESYQMGTSCSSGIAWGDSHQGDIISTDSFVRLVRDARGA
jgi:hypothetical protein